MIGVIFGPPGSGKGTQAALLHDRFNLVHLSTGEILRHEVARGSELGREVARIMQAGQLVPDDLVDRVVQEHLRQVEGDVLLCHGAPDNDLVYLTETTESDGRVRVATRSEVSQRLRGTSAPVVMCAHSHVPRLVGLDDGRIVVNPGSVGLPAYTDTEPVKHSMSNGAPHARYAVLERRKVGEPWKVSFRVVAYDWEGAAARAAQKDREDWARWIRTGYAD